MCLALLGRGCRRLLIGRGLIARRRALTARRWTLIRRRALILRRRTLVLLLRTLVLLLSLLHLILALLHRCATLAHFLLKLVLLIAGQHAHNLLTQSASRVGVDRAAFRMRLRILVDHRLNALLLIAREIEVRQSPHPTMLESRGTRRAGLPLSRTRGLILLGVGAERHGERCDKSAHRQEV